MENQTVILEKMITSLLNEKKYPSLRDILVTMNPSDIASVFDGLEPDRIPLLFVSCPRSRRQKPSWKWSRTPRSC